MKAMIFAAGLGTRLKSMTQDKPKALVEISGKPLLEYSIDYLKNHGITEVVINVHHFADQIIDFLSKKANFGIRIQVSDERDCLLDTGGGLKKAAPLLAGNEPILLLNTDIFTNLNLTDLESFHNTHSALATVVVRQRETQRYLLFDRERNLSGWKNEKTGEMKISRPNSIEKSQPYAFSGIHLIRPEMLDLIIEDGKFSMIDLYLRLAQNHPIKAYIDSSSIWMDLGKAEQFADAEKLVATLSTKDKGI